jgi:hypothetical protein
MFLALFVEKIKPYMLRSKTLFRKSCQLVENLEQFRIASLDTNNNTLRRRKDAIGMSDKSGNYKETHTEYEILTDFPSL